MLCLHAPAFLKFPALEVAIARDIIAPYSYSDQLLGFSQHILFMSHNYVKHMIMCHAGGHGQL